MMRLRQRGASIAGLLVATVVGMFATLMAAGLLVSANAAYQSQVDAAAVDDGGRYALEVITRALRQAAFVNWEREDAGLDPGAQPARLAGLDARTLSRATDGIDGASADAVNGSDVLAVRFSGSGAGSGGDGSMANCGGFGVGAQDDGWSIFYVGRSGAGEAELRCKYRSKSGWGADAVIAGIDTFQVLYGLDTDSPPDGVANQYVSAAVLQELDAALVLEGASAEERERDRLRRTHWKRVTSVQVALVLHGAAPTRGTELKVFDLFGPAYSDRFGGSDTGVRLAEASLPEPLRRRERKLFVSSVLLRNSLEGGL